MGTCNSLVPILPSAAALLIVWHDARTLKMSCHMILLGQEQGLAQKACE
jgi:hypothetical protein